MCYFFQILVYNNNTSNFLLSELLYISRKKNTMKYEFRYRLKPDVPSHLVTKWKNINKTLKTERIQSNNIKHLHTLDEDIVFQLVRDDSVDIEKLVVIRDTLKSVFIKHIGSDSIQCGICFMI